MNDASLCYKKDEYFFEKKVMNRIVKLNGLGILAHDDHRCFGRLSRF